MSEADDIRFAANVAEYAAKKGIPFWQAKQVADFDYWYVLGEIHQWGAA